MLNLGAQVRSVPRHPTRCYWFDAGYSGNCASFARIYSRLTSCGWCLDVDKAATVLEEALSRRPTLPSAARLCPGETQGQAITADVQQELAMRRLLHRYLSYMTYCEAHQQVQRCS